ncbi:MAG: hypothetical protein MZV70_49750 [Desulfobacterales bacterium]|nr:hypothetical protein [Desulfobacterales bacterium]
MAIDVKTDKLMGVGVTTHNETPGSGRQGQDATRSSQRSSRGCRRPGRLRSPRTAARSTPSAAPPSPRAPCAMRSPTRLGVYETAEASRSLDKMKDVKKYGRRLYGENHHPGVHQGPVGRDPALPAGARALPDPCHHQRG